uniref:NADH-ubiquinone oxidoreductase chain 6 n=1 Tax=Pennaria disticha TaxID=264068 RepID=G9ISZ5_9CNID|nr:NADH dehydrogenase subunit 6 [Pennaria disticha]
MNQLFIFLSILIIITTFMTIISFNPMHSIFWLVIVFLFSSILLLILNYEFLGFMIIIIYIGAISILFLFVIMMLDIFQISKIINFNNILPLLFFLLIQFIFFINYDFVILNKFLDKWNFNYKSDINLISNILYNDFGLVFILLSLILLIALIGAILLTLDNNIKTKKQILLTQHQRNL